MQQPDIIQGGIHEAIRLTKADAFKAAHSIVRELTAALSAEGAEFGHSGVRARDASVAIYLGVAERDLAAGNGKAALISLETALTTWTRWPVQKRTEEGPP